MSMASIVPGETSHRFANRWISYEAAEPSPVRLAWRTAWRHRVPGAHLSTPRSQITTTCRWPIWEPGRRRRGRSGGPGPRSSREVSNCGRSGDAGAAKRNYSAPGRAAGGRNGIEFRWPSNLRTDGAAAGRRRWSQRGSKPSKSSNAVSNIRRGSGPPARRSHESRETMRAMNE